MAAAQSDLIKQIDVAPDKEIIRIAQKLSALGIDSPSARKKLTEKLSSKNANVRGACVDAIPYLGEASDETIHAIFDSIALGGTVFPDSVPYGEVAADALEKIGQTVVPVAIKRLATKNDLVYFAATDVIHRMGPNAKQAVPVLLGHLKPGKRQWSTVFALAGIGRDAKQATGALIKMLDSDQFNTVCIVCRALATIGPAAQAAKPKLVKLASEGNVSERGRALQALGGIGVANDQDVKPLFEKGVVAFHQTIKERAVLGIGYLGKKKGKEFIPLVVSTIEDTRYHNKPYSALTLYRIGGPLETVTRTLLAAIKEPAFELDVIQKLGELGPDGKQTLPRLKPYLDSADDGMKALVIGSIGKIGLDDESRGKLKTIMIEGDYLSVRAAREVLDADQAAAVKDRK